MRPSVPATFYFVVLGLALAGASALAGTSSFTAPDPAPAPATVDTSAAVHDSTPAAPPRPIAPTGSPGVAASADSAAAPDTAGFAIPVDAARKEGDASWEELWRGRRPGLFGNAPLFGPLAASIVTPDVGSRIRPWPRTIEADHATDRTVVASLPYLMGVPALATAWDDPEADGVEPFDFVWIDRSLAPEPFRAAGQLLSLPTVTPFSDAALSGDARLPRRVRSALYYRRGDGHATDTGARFSTPLLARGVAASFSRHEADGLGPLLESLSSRYFAAAALPHVAGISSWIAGRLVQKRIEMDYPGGYDPFLAEENRARAEWAAREAELRARYDRKAVDVAGSLRVGTAKQTQIGYPVALLLGEVANPRERWSFPEIGADLTLSGQLDESWSWSLDAKGASRRIEYRADSIPAFRPRLRSSRATAGLRRAGRSHGIAADIAADWREGDRTFFDARASVWTSDARGKVRLDLESAHERPSYVDLLTPERTDSFAVFALPKTLVYHRAGNPSLEGRALRGALAAGSYAIRPGMELQAFGSVRRVTGDFGWATRRVDTPLTVSIEDAAVVRGEGWAYHAAAGGSVAAGSLRLHGLGWTRGGTRGLSPLAGSPPRWGVDAGVGARLTLFRGDLPVELEIESHASGSREGLIRAPSLLFWDGSIRGDFGSTGIFVTLTNVFDEEVPGAFYEIDRDAGALLTPRAFHFGVVWYLLD